MHLISLVALLWECQCLWYVREHVWLTGDAVTSWCDCYFPRKAAFGTDVICVWLLLSRESCLWYLVPFGDIAGTFGEFVSFVYLHKCMFCMCGDSRRFWQVQGVYTFNILPLAISLGNGKWLNTFDLSVYREFLWWCEMNWNQYTTVAITLTNH